MKQVSQNYRTGELSLTEVPMGMARRGQLLVQTAASLVSAGTEKSMIELARKSLIGKALARPDLVRQVIAKAQSDGILEAWNQAMGRLDTPMPLGYSSAGVVIDVGAGVEGFATGDRVACTGQGYAGHSEVVSVPVNLCVKIPDGVGVEAAAFVALGGIAIEAVRMARISLGETVAIIGLGLLGQIAIQVARAAGCHVIGMDIDPPKSQMAGQRGAEAVATSYDQLATLCRQMTNGSGADSVIILATAASNEPLEQAAELCRERGRIVITGQVGLDVPRKPFYDKELELVVSRAWGPGIYDSNYAEKGLDYPIGYARWTAKRNMGEFLNLLDQSAVQVNDLITHRFPLESAKEAYKLILEGEEPYIGVLLTYPEQDIQSPRPRVVELPAHVPSSKQHDRHIRIGVIGAGLFARATLLPIIKRAGGFRFKGVATATGLSARHIAGKYGFQYCTTDHREVLNDPDIDLILVLTRHGSHAGLVCEALGAEKHVFVEKPLALNAEQLQQVIQAFNDSGSDEVRKPLLTVGFNRRYSPFAKWIKERFGNVPEPLAIHCTVNAGALPPDNWTYDPEEGGGRIIGEVCHFIDLIQYFTGSVPIRVYAESLVSNGYAPSDNVTISVKMANGAIGSVTYVAGGDKRFPRERVEVFGGGAVGAIDNFKAASFTQKGRRRSRRSWLSIDQGYRGEIDSLHSAINQGSSQQDAFQEHVYTTLATFAAEESLKQGRPIDIDWPSPL